MMQKALLGIVLFPLLGAIANGLFGRKADRRTVHAIAVLAVASSFVLALAAFVSLLQLRLAGQEHAALRYTVYEWFSLSVHHRTLSIPVRFVMDSLSGVMTLVVTGIGLLIHIYSTGYMSDEPSYARFFAYLNLFTASMLILVLGSNLPIMFVGWEGVGVCSYLLIGFWYENPNYAAAGRKAFVANRIGDFGVLLGMFLLAVAAHSLEFSDINAVALQHPRALTADLALGPQAAPYWVVPGVSLATVATLFLFLGCTGKSAQLPLFVWLPDAMAGPTPVSALIHAATMVTSGIYLVCRLSPVFALAPTTMAVIALVGAVTAVMAASVGLVQNDIKKVLAYSTVSQLGFMFAAVGCGAFAAGFMHVYTHAFFKACLFLGAGSVMHAVGAHGDADIRTLGGLRKHMPVTHATFAVSCAAIAGVPFFSGFFSKDEILVGVLSSSAYFDFAPWLPKVVFALLVLGATMTAFYMFRLYFLTFWGEYRGGPVHEHHAAPADEHAGHDEHAAHAAHEAHDAPAHAPAHVAHTPHESPSTMTIPLIVLGVGALLVGYVWIGLVHFEPWVTWLEPALGTIGAEHGHNTPFIALAFGLAAATIGIGLAYQFYYRGSDMPSRMVAGSPRFHQLLMDKWRVDELYDATILAGSRGLARISSWFDKNVIDSLLTEVTTQIVQATSYVFTRMQTGLVHTYGAVMAVGLIAVTFHFIVPHAGPAVVGDPLGMKVELEATRGLAYQYRWDFDGDGVFDTEWSSEATTDHEFTDDDFHGFAVVFEGAAYGARPRTVIVPPNETLRVSGGAISRIVTRGNFSADEFGETWRATEQAGLPTITSDEAGIVIRPGGARVRKNGELQPADAVVHVSRGEHVAIGEARLSVSGLVRPRVQVRNAFGMERAETVSVVVPKVAPRFNAQVAAVRGNSPTP
ncbi:MAG: NADH-quinone oxidoreductase subunit L [Polyangiales bacterium]